MPLSQLIKYSLSAGIALTSFAADAASALTVTPTADGNLLASAMQGQGITISNISFIGGNGTPATNNIFSAATFTGGFSSGLDIDTGIIVSTGNVALAPGPNNNDNLSGFLNLPGDSDLSSLVGKSTFDATVLQFDFEATGNNIFLRLIFASEEYNQLSSTPVTDPFGIFLDGTNIALVPGDPSMRLIASNTINKNENSAIFNNNNILDNGIPTPFDIEYDGFTDVITISSSGLAPGKHTLKLAIGDVNNSSTDSAFLIEAGSFRGEAVVVRDVPDPSSTLGVLMFGILGGGSWLKRRQKS